MIIPNYLLNAQITPDTLRRMPKRIDWLYLTTRALETGSVNFQLDYDILNILARHNSQILSLEELLNLLLNPVTPIYLTDGFWIPENYLYFSAETFKTDTYLFHTSEEIEPYFYDTYFYYTNEYEEDQYDFAVNVPIIYQSNTDFINALNGYIKLYIHAGKNYTIKYY